MLSKHKNICNNTVEKINKKETINDNNIKNIKKRNKNKKKKKKVNNNFSEIKDDKDILNKTINLNLRLLSEMESYIDIKKEIKNTNSFMKYLFTDDIYNDEKYILNNASYCVFIKNIFIQCKLKYIKISYNVKSKDIFFDCNCLLENNDIIEELSKFKNFSDELIVWYNKIINILKSIKENSNKLYNSYIKYKTNNNEDYFQDIDDFIESQYKPLCIHINEGKVENICLENRHNRIFKKEDLDIIEIFNKLEISISTIYIPKNIQECLCFWILNEIKTVNETNNKKIMSENIKLIEGWFYCCINNDIFGVSGNIIIDELLIYNIKMVKNIITLGCYLYFLKYTENNILEIKYIDEIKNNKINVYLIDDNNPKFIFNRKMLNDNNIMIYYIYNKQKI